MLMVLLCKGHVTTVGYNNLYIALFNAGYGTDKICKQQTLNVVKIQKTAREYYGEQIYEQYFAKLSAAILARLVNWKLSSPERYALLAVMAGLDADTLFGPTLDTTDPLLEELLCYKETGVVYAKNDLAVKMGIQPKQLDSLAKKYQFKPFWRQIRQDRNHCIKLLLTDSEYDMLSKGAKENGSESVLLIGKYIDLSCQELYAIWHHMGYSGQDYATAQAIDQSILKYPMVLALQTADMMASKLLEGENGIRFGNPAASAQ